MDEQFSGYDMLSYYTGMFNELDGNPDTLKELQANFTDDKDENCEDIIVAICELEGGKAKYFEWIKRCDEMDCTERHVAGIFNSMTRGMYYKQSKTQKIFCFNSTTHLWEDSKNAIEGQFIRGMEFYMDTLDQ